METMPTVAQRPEGLIYALEEWPPFTRLIFLGLQQASLVTIFMVFMVLVVRESGATEQTALSTLSFAMIAVGLGAVLQCLWKGPVGSGYLAPPVPSAIYLPVALIAAKEGGLPLVFGMTMVAGAFEFILSRFLLRLRWVFPPVVTGIIITAVGFEIGLIGIREILCVAGQACPPDFTVHLGAALLTAAVMMGLSVWGKGPLRLFCTLLGLIIGFGAAAAAGLIAPQDQTQLFIAKVLAFPGTGHLAYAFDVALLGPFLVAGMAAGVRCIGVLTTAQQINDDRWRKPDLQSIRGGVAADGLASLIGGALGSMGMSASPSAVATSKATGATSRYIALAVGAWFLLLACSPKLAALFLAFPPAVVGGTLLFAGCLNLAGGIRVMSMGGLDNRKTFIIGVSLLLGLSHSVYPGFFHNLPHWVDLLTGSVLSIATITAILLNLIFRLGSRRRAALSVAADESPGQRLEQWTRRQGQQWGVRADILEDAAAAVNEALELLQTRHLNEGPVQVTISYDDLDFVADIAYRGSLVQPPPQGQPLPPRSSGDLLFTQGLAGAWACLCPDPVVCNAQGADCRLRLVF
jgi:xanthine permease XanP